MYINPEIVSVRRTKEQALETREALLNAALRIFSENGLEAPRLEDIAQEAGVTRGALYWHFKNKEDLLISLLDFYEERLLQKVVEFVSDPRHQDLSLSERGSVWIASLAEILIRERDLFRIRNLHSIRFPEQISRLRQETNAQIMKRTYEFFTPVMHEIKRGRRERALKCVIMTIDYTLVYNIVFASIDDPVTSGISVKILTDELRQMFDAYLGLEAP
ncbi:MAG: TetR family transcriptional regulator [Phycisphaerales bacterium]|nr:MAG: TetR family transcriptional regulator [Phycisphaerales bacterium]